MGRTVRRAAFQTGEYEIAAGIDVRPPDEPLTFPVFAAPGECNIGADAVIDFSSAKAVPELVEWCSGNNLPLVLCTTGLSCETTELITRVSEKLPIFQSANMSLGVNLMISLLERASAVLGEAGFDIEIVEKHHGRKADAPSGTAFMLANAMNKDKKYTYVTDRSQRRSQRPTNEIGISAVRGGTIVGEHSVIFAGRDEMIEITHSAYSRDVFAAGALKAAEFIARRKPGLYSMRDLINE
jgi:4-hydroxy-tetrahydrodipicolinate reductase